MKFLIASLFLLIPNALMAFPIQSIVCVDRLQISGIRLTLSSETRPAKKYGPQANGIAYDLANESAPGRPDQTGVLTLVSSEPKMIALQDAKMIELEDASMSGETQTRLILRKATTAYAGYVSGHIGIGSIWLPTRHHPVTCKLTFQ